jgi:hypothetical protein
MNFLPHAAVNVHIAIHPTDAIDVMAQIIAVAIAMARDNNL